MWCFAPLIPIEYTDNQDKQSVDELVTIKSDLNILQKEITALRDRMNRNAILRLYDRGVYPCQYLPGEITVFRRSAIYILSTEAHAFMELLISNFGRFCWFHRRQSRSENKHISVNACPRSYSQEVFLNKELNEDQIKKLQDLESNEYSHEMTSTPDGNVPRLTKLVKFVSDL